MLANNVFLEQFMNENGLNLYHIKNYMLISSFMLCHSFQINMIPFITNEKLSCYNTNFEVSNHTDINSRDYNNKYNIVKNLSFFNSRQTNNVSLSKFPFSSIKWDGIFKNINGTHSSCNRYGLVKKWNLTNHREYLIPLASSVFMVGNLIGAIVCSFISDMFGRKPVLGICTLLQSLCTLIPGIFRMNYATFGFFRILQGIGHAGNFLCIMVLNSELLPTNKRYLLCVLTTLYFVLGHIIFSYLAYHILYWKHLQNVTALIIGFFIIPFYFIDESIPWLISKKRFKTATKLLIKSAQSSKTKRYVMPNYQQMLNILQGDNENNNVAFRNQNHTISKTLPQVTNLDDEEIDNGEGLIQFQPSQNVPPINSANTIPNKPLKVMDLFCPPLVKITFLTAVLTFSILQIYMAMLYGTHILPGNQYLNFIVSSTMEIPMTILGTIALRYGRRKPLLLLNSLVILVLISHLTISTGNHEMFLIKKKKWILDFSSFMILRIFNGASMVIVLLYVAELFPTPVRNMGYGINNAFGRIGYVMAPFLSYLNQKHPNIYSILLILLTLLAICAAWFLPQTKGKPLPQTISDI